MRRTLAALFMVSFMVEMARDERIPCPRHVGNRLTGTSQSFHQGGSAGKQATVGQRKFSQRPGQNGDPATAAALEESHSPGGGADESRAAVAGVGAAAGEPFAFQSGDDAGHGRGFDLLGGGQPLKREGAGKDEDGEGGKLRGADAGADIFLADAAEDVDGGGVEAIRHGVRAGAGFGAGRGVAGCLTFAGWHAPI